MKTVDYPVWLAVMPDQRDAARADAGKHPDGGNAIRWSKEDKLWYARPGADLDKLQAWLPDPGRRSGGGDPETEFLDALTDAGLIIDGLPIMDGEIHRVSVTDGPKGNGDGVYRGFLNGSKPGGWFINYWTAKTHKDITKWKATGGESDPEARLHMQAVARQSRDDSARQLAITHARQTAKAKALYDRLPPSDPDHGYLRRKGVAADTDLRQTRNGALVIPFQDVDGAFRTLQYIPPDGEKYLFSEAPKAGHFKVVGGTLTDGAPILYAEGYATARSLNEVTGRPVVMTIDAGNMLNVANVLSARYPGSPHLFMVDFDHSKPVNTGLVMGEQAALNTGGKVIIPDFTSAERAAGLTDFNDMHQSRGTDALRAALLPQINQALTGLHYKENVMATPDAEQPVPDNLSSTSPLVAETTPAASTAAAGDNDSPAVSHVPQRETITLYHGSPAAFSAIDSEKIGLGQNFVGRGFYTDTSVSGVHYAMEEINHPKFHVYELEIPTDSIILDRWDSASLTDGLRAQIREAGKTVDAQLMAKGESISPGLGDRLASCEKIDDNFFMYASSPQGMSILKEAGIAALKDNSYIAIINTDLIDNIRLHSATGSTSAEMTQYIDKALSDVAQDTSRLSKILEEKPEVSGHYDAIRSAIVKLAEEKSRPEEAERLTSVLKHTLVETVSNAPDRKTTITPLNRLYAEAIESLDLHHDKRAATLARVIDNAVADLNPSQKNAAEPVKPEPADPVPLAGVQDNVVPELSRTDRIAAAEAMPVPEPLVPAPVAAAAEVSSAPDAAPVTEPAVSEVVSAPAMAGESKQADTKAARNQGNAQAKSEEILEMSAKGLKPAQIAKELGIGQTSVYRILKAQQPESAAPASPPEPAAADVPVINAADALQSVTVQENATAARALALSASGLSVARVAAELHTGMSETISLIEAGKQQNTPAIQADADVPSAIPAADLTGHSKDIAAQPRALPGNNESPGIDAQSQQLNALINESMDLTELRATDNGNENIRVLSQESEMLEADLGAAPDQRPDTQSSPLTAAFGEENAILVGAPRVAPQDEDAPASASRIDADKLLTRITHEQHPDGKSVLFRLDGEPAFIDRGNRLVMAEGASTNEEKVLAALLTAANHYQGRIELTGSDEFKAFAISVIVANKLDVSMKNALQQADLDAARRAAGQPVAPADAVRGDPQNPRSTWNPSETSTTPPVTPDATHDNAGSVNAQQQQTSARAPEPAAPQVSPAVHTPAEKAREPITGKVTACGQAPYRFETGASESTFITLRTREGSQTFWGKELAGLLRESNLQPGRMVTLQWLGEQPVTVKVPQKNNEGQITHYKNVDTHRNQWSLVPVGGTRVQTGGPELVPLSAVDVNRYTQIQHVLVSRLKIDIDAPPKPVDNLYWLKPDGTGSTQPGDHLSAPRPAHNDSAGTAVMSAWGADGQLDLYLVQGDGHYLQGVVRQNGAYHHVLVSMPDSKEAPPMVVNLLTPEGAQTIGSGNGINRSNGQPVPREHVVVRLTGDSEPRIAKLDAPADLPAALHARLGYDERYKAESGWVKEQPAAAPQAVPATPPRPAQ